MKWQLCLHMLVLSVALVAAAQVRAEEVEFPEEELARESVLPKFEHPKDVLHRHVVNSERFEFGIGGGLEIDEPFYSDIVFDGRVGYHFNDISAVSAELLMWTSGLSSYGNQIRNDPNFHGWDASKAPHPLWGFVGNYEFNAYYGKISITKQSVLTLNLIGYAGLLYINMKGYNSVGGDLGIAQNFFITQWISIRFDLRMLIFPGPNAAAVDLETGQNPSSYPTRIFTNTQANLSLVFIL